MMKLPEGWTEFEFGNCFEFQAKSKIKAGNGKKIGEYKFFTSSDKQTMFIDKYIFDGEYLIFATGGHAGIHYCNEKFATSTDCFVAKVKDNILSKYIYYYLYHRPYLLEEGFKGAGLKHISKEYIQNLKIIYPENKTIQRKIVSILERAEQTKQMRAEADELVDKFLRSLFLEMFGDPIKNPKKWNKKKLKEFGEIRTGNTPSRKIPEYYGAYIDWIKSDNVNTPHMYITKSKEMLSEEGTKVARIVPKRSILVTCIAGSLSCIGNVAITDRNVAFNQQINAIIPNEDVNELFMYHLILNTKRYIQEFSTKSMKGMLSKSVFESIPLIYPPFPLQQKFASIVEKVEVLRKNQKESKQEIENLFDTLMQKAFKGELVA